MLVSMNTSLGTNTYSNMKVNLLDVQQDPSPIKGIEVHVEGIYKTIAVIVDNDCNASGPICLSSAVRLDTM